MPLYEYRCRNCGHQFERIQSFSAPEEAECPVCQGPSERLLSAPAVQFKGSGWYVTDYGSKKSGPMKASADNGSKSEGSSSEKSASTSSDSSTPSAPASTPSKSE